MVVAIEAPGAVMLFISDRLTPTAGRRSPLEAGGGASEATLDHVGDPTWGIKPHRPVADERP